MTTVPINPFCRSVRLAAVLYVGLCLGGIARGADNAFLRIPPADRTILYKVAREYQLSGNPRRLLFAIYLAEQGAPGREMGVLHPQAMRFAGNHANSLRLQARWAAGTILKRYNGNLAEFAVRWCPLNDPRDKRNQNRHWLPNVRRLMEGR